VADDIALIWFRIDDKAICGSRWQVRRWCDDLGLPVGGILSRQGSALAFIRACQATSLTYTGSNGVTCTLSATEKTIKNDLATFMIKRQDGMQLAALKYFAPRRTENGIVSGSHRVMPTFRPDMDEVDKTASMNWVEQAMRTFEAIQGEVTWAQIRRLTSITLLASSAVPIQRRLTMYFCYADRLDPIRRIGELLRRIDGDNDLTCVQLAVDVDRSVFASSADIYLSELITAIGDSMEKWIVSVLTKKRSYQFMSGVWRDELAEVAAQQTYHSTRLSLDLPKTTASLAVATRMMEALAPSASLQDITGQ
jgi:hypothetical protein